MKRHLPLKIPDIASSDHMQYMAQFLYKMIDFENANSVIMGHGIPSKIRGGAVENHPAFGLYRALVREIRSAISDDLFVN